MMLQEEPVLQKQRKKETQDCGRSSEGHMKQTLVGQRLQQKLAIATNGRLRVIVLMTNGSLQPDILNTNGSLQPDILVTNGGLRRG